MTKSIKIVFWCFYLLIQPLFEGFLKLGQKHKNIFVGFLDQMKSLEFAFEINWPLVDDKYNVYYSNMSLIKFDETNATL